MAALEGIRVLDFGHFVAGPLTAQLLAQQGADVIRVDRPGAEDAPRDAFLQLNKQRVTLDLKRPVDLASARELAADADVLIENFRPGVLERLGIGADVMTAANPRLIYCSLPGFGSRDPRAAMPGWEGVIDAATGNCRARLGEAPIGWDYNRPTFTAVPLASNFAAVVAATAIVAALIERASSGAGARIEVPLFDATFELIGGAGAYSVRRGFQIETPLVANGSGTYECADGRFVQFNPIGASMRFLTWFLDAAGEVEWLAEGVARASYPVGHEQIPALRARLAELFLTRTGQEWEELGMGAGVPLCLIRSADEWTRSAHAQESGQVAEVVDPEYGTNWMASSPIHLTESPTIEPRPRRLPGGDASPHFGGGPHVADALPKRINDLRVVDLTQILAGPSAGRILAEYGADVVKVNAPQRDIEAHGLVNRGKRSILIDLQRTEGLELLWELIDSADVVTQNFPEGTAERYGIGYRHVHARRPDIVFVSVSCYGYGGPWKRGRGYEVQGQAVTGLMERAGRGGKPGVLGPYNALDYGTGAMAAFGAMVALFHRTRTGAGQHVWTSLAHTGTFHQATLLVGRSGTEADLGGPELLGTSALQRFYLASDGWFFVGASPAQAGVVAATAGVEAADETALAGAFAGHTARHWTTALANAGVGAHEVTRLPDLLTNDYVAASGLRLEQDSPEVGAVVMPGPIAIVDGKRLVAAGVAPAPGSDAASVLAEIGRTEDLVALEARWVIQSETAPGGWPLGFEKLELS